MLSCSIIQGFPPAVCHINNVIINSKNEANYGVMCVAVYQAHFQVFVWKF